MGGCCKKFFGGKGKNIEKLEEAEMENHILDVDGFDGDEKKLDPKDFVFSKRKGEVLLKEPGSINGQSFSIEECEDCDIYLMDHTAQVTVDECKNCRFFIGPCESSVFIRDCNVCRWIIATQQFRTRDCHDNDVLLLCSSRQPSIESTDRLRLGCFRFNYFALSGQFASSGLSVWNNGWDTVHDFTKKENEEHWSYMPLELAMSPDFIKRASVVSPAISSDEEVGCVVPLTCGFREEAAGETVAILLLFSSDRTPDLALAIVSELVDLSLRRTCERRLQEDECEMLFGDQQRHLVPLAAEGALIGLEFVGTPSIAADIEAAVRQHVEKLSEERGVWSGVLVGGKRKVKLALLREGVGDVGAALFEAKKSNF